MSNEIRQEEGLKGYCYRERKAVAIYEFRGKYFCRECNTLVTKTFVSRAVIKAAIDCYRPRK